MGESGAAHRISGSGLVGRASAFARSWDDWNRIGSSVRGPLLTAAVAILFDQLTRHDIPVPHPFAFLLLTLVYPSATGGSRPGLISALLTILYALHFLAEPGALLHYTPANAYTLLGLAVIVPLSAYMVAELREAAEHGRAVELSRAEAERLDRRLLLLGEANVILAESLDYNDTLKNLARLIVPNLADWCAIHVVSEQGSLQFVAGAHRDPAKDLLVRALCEYETHHPPFGSATERGSYGGVTEDVLRANAQDGEQLKLYRALAASSFLRVPLLAQGRVVGLITLAVGAESARVYGPDDLGFAEELASRASLSVDSGRLHRAAQEANERYGM